MFKSMRPDKQVASWHKAGSKLPVEFLQDVALFPLMAKALICFTKHQLPVFSSERQPQIAA